MRPSRLLIPSKTSRSRKKGKPIHISEKPRPKILQSLVQIITATAIKVLKFLKMIIKETNQGHFHKRICKLRK